MAAQRRSTLDAAGGASNILILAFGANDSFLLTILTNGAGSVTPNDAKVIKANTKVSLKAWFLETGLFLRADRQRQHHQ